MCSGGNMLSVAPVQSGGKYGYYATTGRTGMGDYEDHRNFHGPTINDYDDPYGRIMFRGESGRRPSQPVISVSGHTVPAHSGHRMQHSLSHPRIQSHQGSDTNIVIKWILMCSPFQCQITTICSKFRPHCLQGPKFDPEKKLCFTLLTTPSIYVSNVFCLCNFCILF